MHWSCLLVIATLKESFECQGFRRRRAKGKKAKRIEERKGGKGKEAGKRRKQREEEDLSLDSGVEFPSYEGK
jgi:hypothetical protein